MKNIVAFVIFLAVVGAGIYFYNSAMSDPAMSIPVAYGKPANGTAQFELMVTNALTMPADPVPVDADGNPQWDKWNDAHLFLVDSQGAPVKMEMTRRSELVPQLQQGNLQHFVIAKLKTGSDYTFTFQPKASESTKFVNKFTMPAEGPKFTRVDFEPVH